MTIAKLIAERTLENGGCTMSIDGCEPLTGFAVGTGGIVVPLSQFSEEVVERFSQSIGERVLINGERFGAYIGTWVDNGMVYLDRTVIIHDKDAALKTGLALKQQAIYDISAGACIYTGRQNYAD